MDQNLIFPLLIDYFLAYTKILNGLKWTRVTPPSQLIYLLKLIETFPKRLIKFQGSAVTQRSYFLPLQLSYSVYSTYYTHSTQSNQPREYLPLEEILLFFSRETENFLGFYDKI